MKLRYQMRGLGIGIMVTALLMGVAGGEKIPLSDAEIKAMALELGMVESDSLRLSDIPDASAAGDGRQEPAAPEGNLQGSSAPGDTEAGAESGPGDMPGPDGGEAPEPDAGQGEEDGDISGADDGGTDAASGAGDGQAQEAAAEGDLVTVVIQEGVTSYSVCELLEELGLVEDADSLDYYICSNSYSRSIQEGTYQIAKGTSEEEIVRIIMGNR